MHPLRMTATFLLSTLTACGSSDAGTMTSPETGSAADTPPAPTTSGSSGHATHATHATHADEAGSETAAVTTSGTTQEAHETHGATEPETTVGTTGGGAPIDEYCACMLENCHDQYHGTWGEEHRGSEAMCQAAAAAVPSVGMPAMSGNSLECRLHFCTIGHDDPAACESALGAAPCE